MSRNGRWVWSFLLPFYKIRFLQVRGNLAGQVDVVLSLCNKLAPPQSPIFMALSLLLMRNTQSSARKVFCVSTPLSALGKWAVPSVIHVKAFTKAARPLQPKWARSIHRRHSPADPRRGTVSEYPWEAAGVYPKVAAIRRDYFQAIHQSYLVEHCKRQTHCDLGSAVERRQILP